MICGAGLPPGVRKGDIYGRCSYTLGAAVGLVVALHLAQHKALAKFLTAEITILRVEAMAMAVRPTSHHCSSIPTPVGAYGPGLHSAV